MQNSNPVLWLVGTVCCGWQQQVGLLQVVYVQSSELLWTGGDLQGPGSFQRPLMLTVCEEIFIIFLNIFIMVHLCGRHWAARERKRWSTNSTLGYLERAWNETVTVSGKWSTAYRMLEYDHQHPTGRKAGALWKAHISCLALRPSWDSWRKTAGKLVAIAPWIYVWQLCENKWKVVIDVPVLQRRKVLFTFQTFVPDSGKHHFLTLPNLKTVYFSLLVLLQTLDS